MQGATDLTKTKQFLRELADADPYVAKVGLSRPEFEA
jgi:hypothetical protein